MTLAAPYGVDPSELFRKTHGNPFFVVSVLASPTQAIPETVRAAILGRAARLSDRARRVLEAVSIVPPRAEVWLLEAMFKSAVGALNECLSSGLLVAEATGVAFRHELARLAVSESVVPDRLIELHRRALAALANPPDGDPDLARLAHHAQGAADAEAVLRYAIPAAQKARSLGAHREAAAQYSRALGSASRFRPRSESNC